MSSSDCEPGAAESPMPQKRSKAKPQHRTPVGDTAAREPRKLAGEANQILETRLVCRDKLLELNAIASKDEGAEAMITAIRKVADTQKWHKFIAHHSRHGPEHPEAHIDPQYWDSYTYTCWDVISRLLDLVFLHIEIIKALRRREYRTLWAYTQVEESVATRVVACIDFLTAKGEKLTKNHSIVVKNWAGGAVAQKWIEVFQVTTATFQEDEDLLDFRIW